MLVVNVYVYSLSLDTTAPITLTKPVRLVNIATYMKNQKVQGKTVAEVISVVNRSCVV